MGKLKLHPVELRRLISQGLTLFRVDEPFAISTFVERTQAETGKFLNPASVANVFDEFNVERTARRGFYVRKAVPVPQAQPLDLQVPAELDLVGQLSAIEAKLDLVLSTLASLSLSRVG